MKKLIKTSLLLIVLLFAGQSAFAQVNSSNHYVRGYTKSNGTYVQGQYKTKTNSTNNDNYTTKPNVNPYTGAAGTVSPRYTLPTLSTPTYSPPTYKAPTYSAPVYRTTTPTYFIRSYSF